MLITFYDSANITSITNLANFTLHFHFVSNIWTLFIYTRIRVLEFTQSLIGLFQMLDSGPYLRP